MYSSEDLERFYFQYQTEALPHGESLQSFCVKNKVPYNIFQKWYKDTRKKVVEVQVDAANIKWWFEECRGGHGFAALSSCEESQDSSSIATSGRCIGSSCPLLQR